MKRRHGIKVVKQEKDEEEEEEEEKKKPEVRKKKKKEEEKEEEEEEEREEDEEQPEDEELEEQDGEMEVKKPMEEAEDDDDDEMKNPMEMISTLFNGRGGGGAEWEEEEEDEEEGGRGRRKRTTNGGGEAGTGTAGNRADLRETRHFNATLVEEVSRHPALFDFTNQEYKSTEARNRHWDQVAEEMGQTVEFVRTRWKTLRDRFKKEVRRNRQNGKKGGEHLEPGAGGWQHYEEMLYLLPFIRDKLIEDENGGGGGKRQQQKGKRRAENGVMGTGDDQQAKQPQGAGPGVINSCTAAILDLAMNAVSKLGPPGPADDEAMAKGVQPHLPAPSGPIPQPARHSRHLHQSNKYTTPSEMPSTSSSCPISAHCRSPPAVSASSSASSSGATAIVTTSLLRPFPSAPHFVVENQAEKREGGARRGGEAEGMNNNKWEQDDRDEDELFCKIVYRKLRRLAGDERLKEYAKARIMDLLVDIQCGDTGCAGNAQQQSPIQYNNQQQN